MGGKNKQKAMHEQRNKNEVMEKLHKSYMLSVTNGRILLGQGF